MSVQVIMKRIQIALQNQDVRLDERPDFHVALSGILEDFDTNILIKADDASGGEVIQVLSDIASVVSDHRKRKFAKTKDKPISASDFVPAFGYISSLGRSRYEYRAVLGAYRERFEPRRGIFSEDIVALIRDSCPWCG